MESGILGPVVGGASVGPGVEGVVMRSEVMGGVMGVVSVCSTGTEMDMGMKGVSASSSISILSPSFNILVPPGELSPPAISIAFESEWGLELESVFDAFIRSVSRVADQNATTIEEFLWK